MYKCNWRGGIKYSTEENASNTARSTRLYVISVSLDHEEKGNKQVSSYGILFPIFILRVFDFIIWLKDTVGAPMVVNGAIYNLLSTYVTCASGCKYIPGRPSVRRDSKGIAFC